MKHKILFLTAFLLALTLLITAVPWGSAATTATVSGTIRHAGQPLAGVDVTLAWDSGSKDLVTGADGRYSAGGIPAGGVLRIFVRPPIALGLAWRNWGTDALPAALTKDFDLQAGRRLQGEFRAPDGTLYAGGFWLPVLSMTGAPPVGEWFGSGVDNGRFDLILPPGVYALNWRDLPRPFFAAPRNFDLRSADLLNLTIPLTTDILSPFESIPPDATRISVSAVDDAGVATVSGAAGSVPAAAAVALVNLNSGSAITTMAAADGSFSARLFAPPGSALLVKTAKGSVEIGQFWQDVQFTTAPEHSNVNPLPGTILPVGKLPVVAGANPFHAAGRFGSEKNWGGWWLDGELRAAGGVDLLLAPGEEVQLHGRAYATSAAYACALPIPYQPRLHLFIIPLFDGGGRGQSWNMWFNAHLFTPTGLPFEQEGGGQSWNLFPVDVTNLTCAGAHTLRGDLDANFTLPAGLPAGIYRLQGYFDPGGVPAAPNTPAATIWYHDGGMAALNPLTLGDVVPPRAPWTLFGDTLVNGQRGVPALEDAGRYAMPNRIQFPAYLPIIPRTDPRTGDPLTYRLEPFSQWISGTDRRLPCPPHIPFAFGDSSLVATVHKPDGAIETIGPAPIRQSSVRTPTTPGGAPLASGTGQIADLYQLYTGDEAFAYQFDQYGLYTIVLEGFLDDIYGNQITVQGTYEFLVARPLDLDPGQLPSTPYVTGDAFAPNVHVFPPVPAEIGMAVQLLPNSDPAQAIIREINGRANRFGIFQPPPETAVRLTKAGEFRVDYLATYVDPEDQVWAGTMTWGNVVEGPAAQITAHGRRGMDYKDDTIDDMPPWFRVFDLPPDKVGIENYYPYFSGDIHWGNEDRQPGDSIHSIITIKDKGGLNGPIYNLIRASFPRNRNGFRWPPEDATPANLEKRLAVGEAPLFTTTSSGRDPAVYPTEIDQFAYWYGSSERPDVRVREIVSADNMGTAYWRFDDTYGYQIGEPADGDQPGDIKWEFGGTVFRVPAEKIHEYAAYSSLWVMLPHGCDAYGCARVTPPFQDATGAGINGGPILELLGKDIDMLFLPKSVRPGDILEVGDTVAFSGHVGPPLDSKVDVTITAPSGAKKTRSLRANKIGWVYDPAFDFSADEPGMWIVDVAVTHDRPYVGNGVTPASHNTGTVLGTTGRYAFYVVRPDAPRLALHTPQPGFLPPIAGEIAPILVSGSAPQGSTAVHYTIHDKGIIMGQGNLTPSADGRFQFAYDPVALHQDFPMLALTAHEGLWRGLADEVTISFLATGGEAQATTVTLLGEEVFVETTPLAAQWIYLPAVWKK